MKELEKDMAKIATILSDVGLIDAYDEIIAAYSEPWRYYHNLYHIKSMLDGLDKYLFDSNHDKLMLQVAIIYHDLIYKIGASDNEWWSAELFSEHAYNSTGYFLVNPLSIDKVHDLIMYTKDHETDDKLGKIIIELDLSGFDGPFENVLEVEDKVCREFTNNGSLDMKEYYTKKIAFLKAYQNKPASILAQINIKFLTSVIKHRLYNFDINKTN